MERPISLDKPQREFWMSRLIRRAELAGSIGEVPVSALILDNNGRCIGYGSNTRQSKKEPLGHAELIAIRQASRIKGDWRFNNCTLLVTLEPCTMCAGALTQVRMGQVIFGAHDPKRGGLGGTIDLSKHQSSHHKMIIKGGIMENKTKDQLQSWFKQQRQRSAEKKGVQIQAS